MTLLAFFVLLWLVSKYSNLLTLAILKNLSVNSSLSAILTSLKAVVCTDCKNCVECYILFSLSIKLFDIKNIAFSNLVLLTACNNNSVQSLFISFSSLAIIGGYCVSLACP